MIGIKASESQGYAKSRKLGEPESEKGGSFFFFEVIHFGQ